MKIQWDDILRKITSRKFILAVFGAIFGALVAMGEDATELMQILGTITTLVSGGLFIVGESAIDAARVKNLVEYVEVEDSNDKVGF